MSTGTAKGFWLELRETLLPRGLCIACDSPLPPPKPGGGRPRVICSSECRSTYQALYYQQRRELEAHA